MAMKKCNVVNPRLPTDRSPQDGGTAPESAWGYRGVTVGRDTRGPASRCKPFQRSLALHGGGPENPFAS